MANKLKVACILGPNFEDVELSEPVKRMRDEGYEVTLIGPEKGKKLEGKQGKVTGTADAGIGEVRPEDFDLLFIPGGFSPDKIRADARFVEFVKAFDEAKKPIAAICHGPQLFLTARIIKGRTLTAWKTVQDDLELAGANVRDEAVVRDGNWITSRGPDDVPKFSQAIVDFVQGKEKSEGMGLHA